MVFYLCWDPRRPDDLLCHFLKRGDVSSAADVVSAFSLINPDSATAAKTTGNDVERIRAYIDGDAGKASKVHSALEAALEAAEAGRRDAETVARAHGAEKE